MTAQLAENLNLIVKELNLDHIITPKGVDIKSRTTEGWISTIYIDRDGEIVIPEAFEQDMSYYLENPILILSHMHKSLPIGKMIEHRIVPNEGVWAKFYITKNPIGDEVLTLLSEGCLRGFSAGFVPIEFELDPPVQKIPSMALKTAVGRKPKKLYRRVELVEVSLLAIPSNRGALVDKAFGGNKAADLAIKALDAKLTLGNFYSSSLSLKSLLFSDSGKVSLKGLFWDESEHPRDNSGRFTDSGGSTYRSNNFMSNASFSSSDDQKKDLQEIKDKIDGVHDRVTWLGMAKIWGTRILLGWLGWRAFKMLRKGGRAEKLGDAARQRVRQWAAKSAAGTIDIVFGHNPLKKGFFVEGSDQQVSNVEVIIKALDNIRLFLEKGKKLGQENTLYYNKLLRFYNLTTKRLLEMANISINKSIEVELILKEMTPEEFKEEEHPRNTDGTFKDKYAADKPSESKQESGQWGGARQGAGRLPKNAVVAKQRLEERFREENPNISREELDQRVLDHAIEKGNTDLVFYMSDPVSYEKEQKRRWLDSMASRGGRAKFRGQDVDPAEDPAATSLMVDDIKKSVSKWQRSVEEAKGMKDAIDTFKKEDSDTIERNKARAVIAVSLIASAIGLSWILRKRPDITKSLLKTNARTSGKAGIEGMAMPVMERGRPDSRTVVTNTLFKVLDIKDRPKDLSIIGPATIDSWKEIYRDEAKFTSKLLGKFIGKDKAVVFGPNWTGYKNARWRQQEYFITHVGPNYVPRKLDISPEGYRLIDEDGLPNALNIAISRGIVPKKPSLFKGNEEELRKFIDKTGLRISKVSDNWYLERKTNRERKFLDYLSSDRVSERQIFQKIETPTKATPGAKKPKRKAKKEEVTEEIFEANKEKYPGGRKDSVTEEEILPPLPPEPGMSELAVPYPQVAYKDGTTYRLIPEKIGKLVASKYDESERRAFEEAADTFIGYNKFLDEEMFPLVTRKTLAYIAALAPAGTSLYYLFNRDIEDSFKEVAQQRNKQEKKTEEAAKAAVNVGKEGKKSVQDELALIKAKTEQSKQRYRTAEMKALLESGRRKAIQELIDLGLRKPRPGSTGGVTLTESVLLKRINEQFLKDMGYPNSQIGLLRFQRDIQDEKIRERLVREIWSRMNDNDVKEMEKEMNKEQEKSA